MPYTTRSSLLERIKSGDEISWSEFYRTYEKFANGIGRKQGLSNTECADLVQQTMIAIFHGGSIFHYDSSAGKFRNFLAGIIRNKIRDIFRSRIDSVPIEDVEEPVCDGFENIFLGEYRDYLLKLILDELRKQVEADTFEAFQLSELQGFSAAEAAKMLDTSPANIYNRVSRCRKKLQEIRKSLQKEDGELLS